MHVLLFPIRRFVLCAIAFALGKLGVVLKIADQSCATSHFNSQNTHSQFRNSHFTRALYKHGSDMPINLSQNISTRLTILSILSRPGSSLRPSDVTQFLGNTTAGALNTRGWEIFAIFDCKCHLHRVS